MSLNYRTEDYIRSKLFNVLPRMKNSQKRFGCVFMEVRKGDMTVSFDIQTNYKVVSCTIKVGISDIKDALALIKEELIKSEITLNVNLQEWKAATEKK